MDPRFRLKRLVITRSLSPEILRSVMSVPTDITAGLSRCRDFSAVLFPILNAASSASLTHYCCTCARELHTKIMRNDLINVPRLWEMRKWMTAEQIPFSCNILAVMITEKAPFPTMIVRGNCYLFFTGNILGLVTEWQAPLVLQVLFRCFPQCMQHM